MWLSSEVEGEGLVCVLMPEWINNCPCLEKHCTSIHIFTCGMDFIRVQIFEDVSIISDVAILRNINNWNGFQYVEVFKIKFI